MKARSLLRGLGLTVVGLVALVALAFGVATWRFGQVMARRHTGPALAVSSAIPGPPATGLNPAASATDTTGGPGGVAPDSALLARGAHLLSAFGCQDCHGPDLGGQTLADAPPMLLATPNLTRGGIGVAMTPASAERAIRHGFGADGRPLFVMPAYATLADADVAAIVAALRALPPVEKPSRHVMFKPLGKVLVGLGMMKPEADRIIRIIPPPAVAPTGPTAETGRYLVATTCVHCHGADLRGAPHPDPGAPPSPSLEAAAGWSDAQFMAALREGKRVGGKDLDPRWMPWQSFKNFSDDEITGTHRFLQQHFRARAATAAAR